jgi:flagellar protein FlgJ
VGNPVAPTYYADFQGLEGLKGNVKANDPKAIRAAAQQFESLFTNMMLKSMREAKLSSGLGDSQEGDLYQDMYDQQIALKMSQGKGLGLADMLVAQLTRNRAMKAGGTGNVGAVGAAGGTGAGAGAAGAATRPAALAPINGAVSAPAESKPAPTTADKISFMKNIEPFAQQAGSQLGVAPDTLIAQAALETGWGQHMPTASNGSSSSNLFGIKAGSGWSADSVNSQTTEVINGQTSVLPQAFRSYGSMEQGVNDYVSLLTHNARYQQALGTGSDVHAFAGALARGGYATDPHYVQKLQATAAAVKALRATDPTASLKLLAGVPTTGGGES